jgi:hypothetical protein
MSNALPSPLQCKIRALNGLKAKVDMKSMSIYKYLIYIALGCALLYYFARYSFLLSPVHLQGRWKGTTLRQQDQYKNQAIYPMHFDFQLDQQYTFTDLFKNNESGNYHLDGNFITFKSIDSLSRNPVTKKMKILYLSPDSLALMGEQNGNTEVLGFIREK